VEPDKGERFVIYRKLKYSACVLGSGLQALAATVLIGGVLQSPTLAETQLRCNAPSGMGVTLLNQVSYVYSDGEATTLNGISETISGQVTTGGALNITPQGIKDSNGNLVYNLGTIATALNTELLTSGWSQDEANLGSVAAVKAFAGLPADATYQQAITAVKAAIAQIVPARAAVISSGSMDQALVVALMGLAASSLKSIGLTETEAQTATNAAIAVITTTVGNTDFSQMAQTAFQDAVSAVPAQASPLNAAQQALASNLSNIQAGKGTTFQSGDTLRFEFTLTNTGSAPIQIESPTATDLQQTGMTGAATVTAVSVEGMEPMPSTLSLAPGQKMNLRVETKVGTIPTSASPLLLALGNGCGGGVTQQSITLLPPTSTPLTDPFGRITGCRGETLSDYRGIRVAIYRPAPNDNTGDVRDLLRLPTTELPDNPNNNIPAGLDPNRQNINPFALTNNDQGKYNFLLTREQLRPGSTYIMVISPPSDSDYSERRVRITIGDRTPDGVSYQATALDGNPIGATDNRTSITGTLRITDAAEVGVSLSLLDLDTSICQPEAIQIIKTGDRASAAPGDTVIYRLLVRNLSTTAIDNLVVTDTLPLGFSLLDDSVQGEIQGRRNASITTSHSGSTVSFQVNGSIPVGGVLNIAYGAQLTPDALRGTGQNTAIARGRRDDNNWVVRDGPAVHRLRIEPGIITDCGTILGRVFVDKNYDGEQQPGEPGVPNAVIYMDDGNRITTDANGLFSVANVLSGYRNGALDLTSLPGYTLAPNHRFIERNSPSRLVHLEPGGMVRMNFAVTPTFQEEAGQ
jgi:uncharacterized repeat protein (TIGR01451 family)